MIADEPYAVVERDPDNAGRWRWWVQVHVDDAATRDPYWRESFYTAVKHNWPRSEGVTQRTAQRAARRALRHHRLERDAKDDPQREVIR